MRLTQRPCVPLLFALTVAACGGGQKGGDGTTTAAAGGDEVMAEKGGGDRGAALPAIPDAPAPAPAALVATLSIGDPKGQIAEIGAYVDAIQPGMGAMIGQFLPQMAGMAGAPALDGYDLSRPVYALFLDPQRGGGEMVLVCGVADEKKLVASVQGGGAVVQVHGGFAAIGKPASLQVASPYALSNLVKTVGSSRVDLQACKLEYSIVSPK